MDMEAEYNNRARVPDHPAFVEAWGVDAASWRAACPRAELDLSYGDAPREKLDLFHPGSGPGPVALFVHGGYWQALDRTRFSHMARGLNAHGVAVAVPSYDLCPAVTIGQIVAQMRAAAVMLYRRTGQRMLAIGHSAGGHLAAMLLATDWRAIDPILPADLVAAALPISGVFELAPLRGTSTGVALRLDAATIGAFSPRFLPSPGLPLHCVVGAAESQEFLRQSRDMAEAWGGGFEAVPGAHHFSVIGPLAEPNSALTARAKSLVPG